MNEPVPDFHAPFSSRARTTAKDILKKDKTAEEKLEEALGVMANSPGWNKAMKPYIKRRIETMKSMAEVNLDGTETMSEIGLRLVICSAIAEELKSIIDKADIAGQSKRMEEK